mmetsp:Transcript_109417/g.320280  ORF Transcript_109417/g.320280 Transcript_109417/m.320280 type:complete len:87 (+) Transcript_109417:613-873(+)
MLGDGDLMPELTCVCAKAYAGVADPEGSARGGVTMWTDLHAVVGLAVLDPEIALGKRYIRSVEEATVEPMASDLVLPPSSKESSFA